MKAKVTVGNSFGGTVNYLFSKKDAEEVTKNLIIQSEYKSIIDEFNQIQKERIKIKKKKPIKKPVFHCSLSLPVEEKLTTEKWEEITEAFLRKMQVSREHQYIVVRHKDTKHDHVHIVLNKINAVDYSVWHGDLSAIKAIKATQELEKEYNLVQTKSLNRQNTKKRAIRITNNEYRLKERTQDTLNKEIIKNEIDKIEQSRKTCSIEDFQALLYQKGIVAKANIAKTGKMNGFSFLINGVAFKGSKIGKKYGWKGLQDRNIVQYNQPSINEKEQNIQLDRTQ